MDDADSSTSDEEDKASYSGMTRPTLIGELKNILEQYPDNGQIIKELIQNAEDARASVVEMCIETGDINKNVVRPSRICRHLQGPALCMYNDAKFANDDWDGIKMLQCSIKKDDPLKIGRFGLGFKSVFHLTDYPCIISGSRMLFIDPHQPEDRVNADMNLNNLSSKQRTEVLAAFGDMFGFTKDTLCRGVYDGTLFWFPLRQMPSELSANLYDVAKLQSLFESFETESALSLIFVKSVGSIAFHVRENSSLKPLFRSSVTDASMENRKHRTFVQEIGNLPAHHLPPIPISAIFKIEIDSAIYRKGKLFTKKMHTWTVAVYFMGGQTSSSMQSLVKDTSLNYSPLVGIAMCNDPSQLRERNDALSGHVFCFLPLPLQSKSLTGLPVHVNGFFALSHERQHLKWTIDGEDLSKDRYVQWNRCLIEEILPKAYKLLILNMIEDSKAKGNDEQSVSSVYDCIPNITRVDPNWQMLLRPLFSSLLEEDIIFTKTGGGQWVTANDAIICRLEDYAATPEMVTVVRTFLAYNKNVALLPSHLGAAFEYCRVATTPVSARLLCDILHAGTQYQTFPSTSKLDLLLYILKHEQSSDLDGLELLPLDNSKFCPFSTTTCTPVYKIASDLCDCFSGLENICLAHDLTMPDLTRSIDDLVTTGMFQLKEVSATKGKSWIPDLVNQSVKSQFGNGSVVSVDREHITWLTEVWKMLCVIFRDDLKEFENICLVPKEDGDGNLYLYKLNCLGMMSSYGMNDVLYSAVEKLGVVAIPKLSEYVDFHPLIQNYVAPSTPEGLISCLGQISNTDMKMSFTVDFNSTATILEKEALLDILSEYNEHLESNVLSMLQQLQIWKEIKSIEDSDFTLTSFEKNKEVAPVTNILRTFPTPLILREKEKYTNFMIRIGFAFVSENELAKSLLQNALRDQVEERSELQDLIFDLMRGNFHVKDATILSLIKDAKFVPCSTEDDRLLKKPSELFTSEDYLTALFMQQDLTPIDSFSTPEHIVFLKVLGLKTIKDITSTQVLECAGLLDKWQNNGMHGNTRNAKAVALLKVLAETWQVLKDHDLDMIRRLHCVPCLIERPLNFPQVLDWYGETVGNQLCRPLDMCFPKYITLVGSVMPLPATNLATGGLERLLSNSVPTDRVLRQLLNVAGIYTPSCKGHILRHVVDIMEHLSSQPYDFVEMEITKSILKKPFMWTGSDFATPAQIFLEQKNDDISLIPYMHPLPAELKNVKDFCRNLGCFEQQTPELLVHVMAEIKEHHDASEECVDCARVTRDLLMIRLILERLQQDPKAIDEFQSKLLIPVETEDNTLKILPVKQCAYCETSWLQSAGIINLKEDEVVHIVHPSIRNETAERLGVPSLNQAIMADVDTNFYEGFGQNESLYKRLRGLLEDYADGLSIFLELIQNADDAGAGVVKFLYDERENKDLCQHLFDDGMKECQGAALWAYNDAVFTDKDFQNITDLGGATKENDNTKIGKFGIGFNAVYNLTDVPSFVSGYQVAFFDPRRKYLGNSIEGQMLPGLKLDTRSLKNRFVLQKWDHQFKPYDGVFGCSLTSDNSPYEGTLFRFPLRTMAQLSNKDDYICNKAYTKSEVQGLFEKFVERAGDVLLFTQNVKEVEFHFLPSDAVDAKNTELLLKVTKTTREYSLDEARQSSVKNESMVKWAQEMLQSGSPGNGQPVTRAFHCNIETTNHEQMQKVFPRFQAHLDCSTTSWLLIWAFGCKDSLSCAQKENAKLLPLSAVALPVTNENECLPVALHTLPQGHSKVGHMYCFLPLPVTSDFPLHIHASFAVTRNRKHLCEAMSGEKDAHEADWNSALFSDAICSSYVSLLGHLKQVDPLGEHYEVWPSVKSEQSDMLVHAFYQEVQQNSELAIFRGKSDWLSFQDVFMLDSQFRCIPDIGNRAQKILEDSEFANRIVDVPQRIRKCLADSAIVRKVITMREFYERVFLPNIESMPSDDIDPILLYALDSRDNELLTLLQKYKCIPSRPNGVFTFPKDLVHLHETISNLFMEEDGRFPLGTQNTYCSVERLDVLTGLGMLKDDISWTELRERAETVSTMTNFVAAKKRSHLILKQVEKKIGRKESCPEDIRVTLNHTHFLPLLRKPQKWPIVWAGDEYHSEEFRKPCELYLNSLQSSVSCSKPVVESNDICDDVLKWVGVLTAVEANLPICQLKHYSNSNKEVHTNLVEPVYEALSNIYEEQEDSRDAIKQALNSFRSIFTAEKMVAARQLSLAFATPAQIFLEQNIDDIRLIPYVYPLPYELKNISGFCRNVGCFEQQTPELLIHVIAEIKKHHDASENIIDCGRVTRDLQLVSLILERLQQDPATIAEFQSKLLIPVETEDNTLKLLPVKQSAYCETSWLQSAGTINLKEDEVIHIVHPSIQNETAQRLGVPSLNEAIMADVDTNFYEGFGQNESLYKRLRGLLEDYADGLSIFLELIQNADDAGAGVVKFLYDERENKDLCQHLFDDGMKECQGAALWAYNDAVFTDKDFQNITDLGGATKENDNTKIGKFGIGFNAVYNLTDVPSFVSGYQVAFFDPRRKYLGHSIEGQTLPGLKLDTRSLKNRFVLQKWDHQFKPYDGVFGCSLTSDNSPYEGTLFRFPLRTMAQLSSKDDYICNKAYTKSEVQGLFQKFVERAGDILLFTQNVKEVEFHFLPSDAVDAKNTELLLNVTKTIREYSPDEARQSSVKNETMVKWAQEMLQSGSPGNGQSVTRAFHCNIETTNHEQMQKVFPIFQAHQDCSRTSWLLLWAFGCKESLTCARKENAKLLPLSAVALPVTSENECVPVALHTLPQGHSKVGHMHCFLPLPVTSDFPVHIHASFAVTRNRKHLCEAMSGEKDAHGADWNSALFSDAICSSYVNLLDRLGQADPLGEHYVVWPCVKSGQSDMLVQAFYQEVQQNSELAIFRGKSDWLSFQDVLMLESQFRCIRDIGNRAQKILENSEFANRIVDVPQRIRECFTDTAMVGKVITAREFYERVFLPNIESISSDDIDPILLYALDSRDNELLTLLQKYKCIPSRPNGTFNLPEDLVHPHGTISKLFMEEDGRFPRETQGTYCSPERLNVLTELGMLKDDISWTGLLERAETVSTMTNFKEAKKRSLVIMKQAEKMIRREENCPEDIRKTLNNTAFLPLLLKPQQWRFVWAGDEYHSEEFRKPCDLYLNHLHCYVSCSKPVVESNGISQDVLKWVGVLSEVEANLAICQLKHYSDSNQEVTDNLVEPVYQILSDIYEDQEDARDAIKRALNSFRSICIAGEMVAVRQISRSLDRQCKPYLYRLPYFSRKKIEFFVNIGVKDSFVPDDFVNVLKELHDLHDDQPLETSQLNLILNVVHMLSASLIAKSQSIKSIDKSGVFLPDDDSVLRQLSTLCFDDMNSMNISMEMHFLHDGISKDIAESLGIKAKRRWHMQTLANRLPFGQSEKLTSRLRRILSGYPCDQEILKELLQNADDAGATEVLFIIDETQYQGQQVFSDEWAGLQGPALCVFNNKPFTDKDLEGIQRLGEGGKSDDPSKIGQYGVGFNVVYHVTDVPSFLTKSASGDAKLCILDPHCRYAPGAEASSPGAMFTDVDALFTSYPDAMRCYLAELLQKHKEGTLFRLPLRVGNAAKMSAIKAEECNVENVKQMFSNMAEDLHDCLLFLNNVRKVSLCHVTRGYVDVDLVVESAIANANMAGKESFQECQKPMLCNYRDNKLAALDNTRSLETLYELQVTDHKGDRRWLICQRFGLERQITSAVLRAAIEDGKLIALPVGGVAFPLHPEHKVKTRPYCFLPLPIDAGIPVSFNGHFALDHEARRNLWHDENGNGSKSVWNNLLIEEVIAPAYVSGLEAVRDKMFPHPCRLPLKTCKKLLDRYHQYFPMHLEATEDYWKHLVSSVYKHIVDRDIMLFPVITPVASSHEGTDMCEVKWVSLKKNNVSFAYFNTFESQFKNSVMKDSAEKREKQLTAVLLRSGVYLLASPLSVMTSMTSSGVEIHDLLPDVLIEILKDNPAMFGALPKGLHETKFADSNEFNTLLQFCELSSKLTSELDGLPLLLTEDQTLRLFDRNNPVFESEFSDLLPGSYDLFTCRKISMYRRLAVGKRGDSNVCFRNLEITDLATYLPPLYKATDENCITWYPSEIKQHWWMHRLWCFLFKQTILLPSPCEIRKKLDPLSGFCLLPILTTCSTGEKVNYLAPISMAHKVVVFEACSNLEGHISKLDLNILDKKAMNFGVHLSVENTNLFSQIMAQENKPLSIATALTYVSHWKALNVEDFKYLVQYFYQNLKKVERNSKDKFKAVLQLLPIFKTIDQEHVRLKQGRTVVVEEIVNIPFAGIDVLSSKTTKTFHNVSKQSELDRLYEYLDFRSITPTEFYTRYVLPNFVSLVGPSRLIHLTYIRNELLKIGILSSSDEELKFSLRNTPFLMKQGILHTAKSFFAPWISLFDMILSPEDFPPVPFSNPEWKSLLIAAGIQTELTEDLLIKLAKLVECESLKNVDIYNLRKKSRMVIREIFQFPNMTPALCSKLKDVRFIVGHEMDDQYTDIFPQQLKHRGMLAFNKSVPCDQDIICWSTCDLLPIWASQDKWDNSTNMTKETLCQQLGIQHRPSPEQIVLHVTNICFGLSKGKPNVNLENMEKDFLNTLMAQLYEGLTKCPDKDYVRHQLENVPLIYIPESDTLTTMQQVVMELPEEFEILAPYLFKVSVQFGPYFSLFKDLGMSIQPDTNHFARILNQLHTEYMSNTLTKDAMAKALMATKGIFNCLPTDGSAIEVSCAVIWFPSRNCQLVNSKELVIVDKEEFFKRTEQLELQYMVDFADFDCGSFHQQLISSLPDKYCPRLISSMVQEKITERSLKSIVERHEYVCRITERLASPAFLDALVQLMIHQSSLNSVPCLHPDELKANFKKCVDHINIYGVSILETHILCNGKQIDNSVGTKASHTEVEIIDGETKFNIYFKDEGKHVDNPIIYLYITSCIGKILTNKRFGNNFNMYLNQLLQADVSQYDAIIAAMQLESESDWDGNLNSKISVRTCGNDFPTRQRMVGYRQQTSGVLALDIPDSAISVRNVQPNSSIGLAWLRQAQSDMEAARKHKASAPPCHEWKCYQSHQSAEKALKALMYYFGSSGNVNVLEHNLTYIAQFSQEGKRLADTARDLETLLIAHTRMRYPLGDEAPCEFYSERHSCEAARMAGVILDNVKKLIHPE